MVACLVQQLFRQKIGIGLDPSLVKEVFIPLLISGKPYPPGVNPRISYGVHVAIWQSLLRVSLLYDLHPRQDLIRKILFLMTCREESVEKLGLKGVTRGYDPRFWHQLGAPPELSPGVVCKMWRDREEDILEEIYPRRWPIDCPEGSDGLIATKNLPVLYFTKFLELLKTASLEGCSSGLSQSSKTLGLKSYKLSVADCELLSNITSTPLRECSTTRVGYSKRLIRDHLLYIEKEILPTARHNFADRSLVKFWSVWMDFPEKKGILKSWVRFLESRGSYLESRGMFLK
mgnify:CR=1 FL=1